MNPNQWTELVCFRLTVGRGKRQGKRTRWQVDRPKRKMKTLWQPFSWLWLQSPCSYLLANFSHALFFVSRSLKYVVQIKLSNKILALPLQDITRELVSDGTRWQPARELFVVRLTTWLPFGSKLFTFSLQSCNTMDSFRTR